MISSKDKEQLAEVMNQLGSALELLKSNECHDPSSGQFCGTGGGSGGSGLDELLANTWKPNPDKPSSKPVPKPESARPKVGGVSSSGISEGVHFKKIRGNKE